MKKTRLWHYMKEKESKRRNYHIDSGMYVMDDASDFEIFYKV